MTEFDCGQQNEHSGHGAHPMHNPAQGTLTLPTGMLPLQFPRSFQASIDFLDRIAAPPDGNGRAVPKPSSLRQGIYQRPSSSYSEQIGSDSSPSWTARFHPSTILRFALPWLPAPSGFELTYLFTPHRIDDDRTASVPAPKAADREPYPVSAPIATPPFANSTGGMSRRSFDNIMSTSAGAAPTGERGYRRNDARPESGSAACSSRPQGHSDVPCENAPAAASTPSPSWHRFPGSRVRLP